MSLENTFERIAVSLEAIHESMVANTVHIDTDRSVASTNVDAPIGEKASGKKDGDSKSGRDAKKNSGSKKKVAGGKGKDSTEDLGGGGSGKDEAVVGEEKASDGSSGSKSKKSEKQSSSSDEEGEGPAITKDDIKKLLVEVSSKVSGKKAKGILLSYKGVRKLSDLEESDYEGITAKLNKELEA